MRSGLFFASNGDDRFILKAKTSNGLRFGIFHQHREAFPGILDPWLREPDGRGFLFYIRGLSELHRYRVGFRVKI